MESSGRRHKGPAAAQPLPIAPSHAPRGSFAALTVGALGIVYSNIGTSPLYAMDVLFGRAGVVQTPAEVLGGVSLVIWTITINI